MDPVQVRRRLDEERQRIERALQERRPQSSDELSPTDAADLGTDTFIAELDEGISDDLERELDAVVRAEERLAAGTYGISIESGKPIPDERLEVMPTAERTAEEQERLEAGG